MFKSRRNTIIYFLILISFGLLWIYIYNDSRVYKLYSYKDGVKDSTKVYLIAPRYTQKVLLNSGDTAFMYFNIKRKLLITIKKNELKNYIIKRD